MVVPPGVFAARADLVKQTLLDALDQPIGSIFDHVENQIEAVPQAVVRVRNLVVVEVLGITHEQPQAMMLVRGTDPLQYRQVVVVHRQDHVEVVEILCRNLARPHVAQVVVAAGSSALGTLIRRLTDMIAMRPGRIDLDLVLETFLAQHVPHDALRGRRAADVSHTNKKNLDHLPSSRYVSFSASPKLSGRGMPPPPTRLSSSVQKPASATGEPGLYRLGDKKSHLRPGERRLRASHRCHGSGLLPIAGQRAPDGLLGFAATFSLRAAVGRAALPAATFGWSPTWRWRRLTSGAFLSANGLLDTLN